MPLRDPAPLGERDLGSSSLETPRDENYGGRNMTEPDAPSKPVRRSFSWGKKKKKPQQAAAQQQPAMISSQARVVTIDRFQADTELGFEMQTITGDVLVSFVGPSLADMGIEVGECVLAIQGIQLVDGGEDGVEAARYILREPADSVELILQRHVVRTELLKRHAALKGTSLDKLGLTLNIDGEHIMITALDGLGAKARRFAVGDRLIAVNGTRLTTLQSAVDMLAVANDEGLEVELDLIYGFRAPAEHEWDAETGLYVPKAVDDAPRGGFAAVKRTLSFGKRKKAAVQNKNSQKGKDKGRGAAEAPSYNDAPIQELNLEPRLLDIPKNEHGMIQVTFKAHAVTNELIIGLVGEGSPAQLAGVCVGDAVLALQGNMIESDGEFALDDARSILQQTSHFQTVELMVRLLPTSFSPPVAPSPPRPPTSSFSSRGPVLTTPPLAPRVRSKQRSVQKWSSLPQRRSVGPAPISASPSTLSQTTPWCVSPASRGLPRRADASPSATMSLPSTEFASTTPRRSAVTSLRARASTIMSRLRWLSGMQPVRACGMAPMRRRPATPRRARPSVASASGVSPGTEHAHGGGAERTWRRAA